MLDAQKIYGPDDGREWSNGPLAMGRRLYRTLPEDDADLQPLLSRDGRLALVADVRLDNRDELIPGLGSPRSDWRLACDAEILLASLERWGEGALDRLVGDFAFALWNEPEQKLLLARDFLGQRPLHYHCGKDFFAFSTMAKGLHALPEVPYAPDEQVVAEFVGLLPHAGPGCFFAHISRVEPGHVLSVTREGVSSRAYWQPRRPERGRRAADDWIEGVRHHLDQATRSRLRGAGGAVGSHLSAGFDSSAVTATAARLLAPEGGSVTAFTSVPSPDEDRPAQRNRINDEGPLAAATAALYPNVEHVKLQTGHVSPLEHLDQDFFLYERPKLNLCNWVWWRAINQAAHDRGLRVMLQAEMGNMTFSYSGYELLPELLVTGRWGRLWREWAGLTTRGGMRWRGAAGLTFGPFVPGWAWNLATSVLQKRRQDVLHYTAINPERLAEMRLPALAKARGLNFDYRPRRDAFADRLWVMRRTDGGANHKGTLAGWGVDERDPTADRRLVEYCLSIPTDQYLNDGVARAVAKRALADRAPAEVLNCPQRGYQASDWYEGLTAGRGEVSAELDRLMGCDEARRTLDVSRMQRLVEDWPTSGWEKEGVIQAYRLALLRGVSAGHFLRKASGSNA
jgi:asparagine synthase (glutamine-hydrolysing)